MDNEKETRYKNFGRNSTFYGFGRVTVVFYARLSALAEKSAVKCNFLILNIFVNAALWI